MTALATPDVDVGTFTGYLAVLGNRDAQGDTLLHGSLDATVAEFKAGRRQWFLTDAHSEKASDVVAEVVAAAVDGHGLKVWGRWMPTPRAQELRAMVRGGAKLGLSIDYLPERATPDGAGGRALHRVAVFGGAIAPHPVNGLATIVEGKALQPRQPARGAPMAIDYMDVQQASFERELAHLDSSQAEWARRGPGHDGAGGGTLGQFASVKALAAWLVNGMPGLDLEAKAALVENATGQILIPTDLQADILSVAREQGTIRELAERRPTNRNKQRAGMLTGATTGWGRLEITGGPPTDAAVAPQSPAQEIEVFDLVAQSQIGVDELDDSPEAARQAIIDSIASAIIDAEDAAFAAGTGSGQPAGLAAAVARVPAANKVTAAASATPTTADILTLPSKLPTRYRRGGTWLFSEDAFPKVMALTYAAGNGLMERAGEGLGPLAYPFRVIPGLPSMATAGVTDPSIWFINLRRAYRIVDRGPMTVQRLVQRYADVGLVGMLVRWRVGGDLVRADAAAVYLL